MKVKAGDLQGRGRKYQAVGRRIDKIFNPTEASLGWIEPGATYFNMTVYNRWLQNVDWDLFEPEKEDYIKGKRPGFIVEMAMAMGATEEELVAAALLLI